MLFSTITAFSVSALTAFNSPLLFPVNELPAVSQDSLELTIQDYLKKAESKPEKPNIAEQETKVEKTETVWKCKGCNHTETYTLSYLQKQGIKDKNALATIMGNIKQESDFVPNICEGGARVSYQSCGSGGYGLIQWTDSTRFNGLGRHAARIGSSASSLDTQLNYMLNEGDWKMIEPRMKTPGKSIDQYMYYASKWIRWGHHGARTDFAYRYANKMYLDS
jgi:hypothetical protein